MPPRGTVRLALIADMRDATAAGGLDEGRNRSGMLQEAKGFAMGANRPHSQSVRPDCRLRMIGLEGLEDRRLLATFTVANTDDSGPGSLRAAIEQANLAPD